MTSLICQHFVGVEPYGRKKSRIGGGSAHHRSVRKAGGSMGLPCDADIVVAIVSMMVSAVMGLVCAMERCVADGSVMFAEAKAHCNAGKPCCTSCSRLLRGDATRRGRAIHISGYFDRRVA